VLTVRGLSKRFGAVFALRDASFDVSAGEVLGLIGPNGAGKSTLFRCLAGLLAADAGEVRAGDKEGARELEPSERASVLFFLPDGIAPWRDEFVDWTLDFAADAFRAERAWRGEVGEVLRLRELSQRRMGELSKGQRKRVLLGIALCAPQRLILMDEPFDGLDLRHARELSQFFTAQARTGGRLTLFLSIHSMHDAAKVCDRLVLLNEGRVVAEGTLDELRWGARAGEPASSLEDVFLSLTEDPSLRSG
jgi:ABC-type multidrug transport system ATPase subunit